MTLAPGLQPPIPSPRPRSARKPPAASPGPASEPGSLLVTGQKQVGPGWPDPRLCPPVPPGPSSTSPKTVPPPCQRGDRPPRAVQRADRGARLGVGTQRHAGPLGPRASVPSSDASSLPRPPPTGPPARPPGSRRAASPSRSPGRGPRLPPLLPPPPLVPPRPCTPAGRLSSVLPPPAGTSFRPRRRPRTGDTPTRSAGCPSPRTRQSCRPRLRCPCP